MGDIVDQAKPHVVGVLLNVFTHVLHDYLILLTTHAHVITESNSNATHNVGHNMQDVLAPAVQTKITIKKKKIIIIIIIIITINKKYNKITSAIFVPIDIINTRTDSDRYDHWQP